MGRVLRIDDITEVAADGRFELTTWVDPRVQAVWPLALWVDGLYPDQRSIAVPMASDGAMRIALPSSATGRCRIGIADAFDENCAVRVRLDLVGSTSMSDRALPDVWIAREWVHVHTTARTIGGLAPGAYVVPWSNNARPNGQGR